MISIYFLAYNNDTSQMYWPWPEKDLPRFGVDRLKIKVKFGLNFLQFVFRFCLITQFPFGVQWWYFTHVLYKRNPRRTSVDFEVKSLLFILYRFHTVTPFLFDILWWYVTSPKVKGIICVYFMFELLIVSVLLLYYLFSYEPRRTSINFGVKRSWFTWKVWICCRGGMVSL